MTKVTDEQIIAEYNRNSNVRSICLKLGTSQRRTYAVIKRARHSKILAQSKVKTLSDFNNAYNTNTIVPTKIKKALAALGRGGWDYEMSFSRLAEVNIADLGNFRDQFSDYVVELKGGRRAWAGSVSLAKQMRSML